MMAQKRQKRTGGGHPSVGIQWKSRRAKSISWLTVFGMLILCTIMIIGVPGQMSYAAVDPVAIVEDGANLLTQEEENRLLSQAQAVTDRYGYDVMLVTTQDAGGRTSGEYAEEYFLAHYTQDDGFILIIDMDNREINVRTSGAVIPYMNDVRQEKMLDDGYDRITQQDYAGTLSVMLSDMRSFFEQGVPAGQHSENVTTGEITYYKAPNALTGGEILLAVVLSVLVGAGLYGGVNARYKMKLGSYKYDFHKNMTMKLTTRSDTLQNRFVTRRHIPRNPPPSSGGSFGGGSGHTTVHTGAGGHTFGGGGGRKF